MSGARPERRWHNMKQVIRNEGRVRRHARIRKTISGTAERPRLCVRVSNKSLYVQFVDDEKAATLVSATTCHKAAEGSGKNLAAATQLGKQVAEAAMQKGIRKAVFDRGGYRYHGRVKAIADAVREAGIQV
jgi:large subunit ribosomal protein L18